MIYAFIDAQNVYKGVQSDGWLLDWRKFRVYLRDKYRVEKAFIFIGYMSQYQDLYSLLQESGYILVFKPVVVYGAGEVKGNVDAELIVECWRREKEYSQAIIITGDGDFTPLVKILQDKDKLCALLRRIGSMPQACSERRSVAILPLCRRFRKKLSAERG